MSRLILGVLGSGRGTNFAAIQQAIEAERLDAEVRVVISDNADAAILSKANHAGLPTKVLPPGKYRTKLEPEQEALLVSWLRDAGVEWVVLAGYMRVVKAPMLEAFPDRIINIHPSLLPAFRGLEAWRQALEAKVPVTGCTVHLVNQEVDAGHILDQREVPVLPGDTAESLHARIQEAEHELYPAVLRRIAAEEL